MSEIKKVTFRLRKSNFPNFPAQMGKLSLFQHETFCHRPQLYYKQLQTITFYRWDSYCCGSYALQSPFYWGGD